MKTAIIITIIFLVPIVGYILNIKNIIVRPSHQTMTVPNITCGAGIFVPPLGAICGLFR